MQNGKQLIKIDCPISLLPVFGKILERLVYNNMFEFFTENKINAHNKLGSKPGKSCINQLLCTPHHIYQSLDDGLEKSVLQTKAFDKVWHEGLLYK